MKRSFSQAQRESPQLPIECLGEIFRSMGVMLYKLWFPIMLVSKRWFDAVYLIESLEYLGLSSQPKLEKFTRLKSLTIRTGSPIKALTGSFPCLKSIGFSRDGFLKTGISYNAFFGSLIVNHFPVLEEILIGNEKIYGIGEIPKETKVRITSLSVHFFVPASDLISFPNIKKLSCLSGFACPIDLGHHFKHLEYLHTGCRSSNMVYPII